MKKISNKLKVTSLIALGILSVGLTSCNFQGPQGEPGIQGPKGDAGNDGINGKDGYSILNGKGKPSIELGSVGDSYIDLDTWDYYTKSSNGWTKQGNIKGGDGHNGKDGNQGIQGESGKDGTSILNGHGTPTDDLGKKDDSYIDLDTWDYYTKSSNGWAKQGNIKGEKGAPGKDGNDGKDGLDGKTPTIGANGNWWIDGKDTGVSATPTTYVPAIFNNYDGTNLYTFYYEKGSDIDYKGPTPTRKSDYDGDEELYYTFIGWDKSLNNIQEPTIFTAQYRGKMYDVTFKNYDGSTLYATQVERGKSATYVGEIPTRNDKPNVKYIFTGWDKSLDNITMNTIFTAQFYAPDAIKCVFKNYDGTVLSTQYIGEGDAVVYNGNKPIRDDVNNDGKILKYEFSGWDKSLKNITSDTEFFACYTCTTYFEVKFVNYDDTLLYKTSIFDGGRVLYKGEEPIRPQEASGENVTEYTFSNWDKPLSNIKEPTTVRALYNSTSYIGYLVTFLNNDDSFLYSHYYKKGMSARYPYQMTYNYDSKNVNLFVGWDKSLDKITNEITTRAIYKTISRKQNGEYPQSLVTDYNLINSLNSIENKNFNGFYEYNNEQYEKKYGSYFKVEPIHWIYLKQEKDKAFFTSKYILDFHIYDTQSNNYKNSSIRNWLNNDFISKTFNDDSLLLSMEVDNSTNSTYESSDTIGCETTFDKICLLSYKELNDANIGFCNNESRKCKMTDYAKSYDSLYKSYYWTRSPFATSMRATCVNGEGDLDINDLVSDSYGVRPALWLNIA